MEIWIVEACDNPGGYYIMAAFFNRNDAEAYAASKGEKIVSCSGEWYYRGRDYDYSVSSLDVQGEIPELLHREHE